MSEDAINQRWRKPAQWLAVEDTWDHATGDLGRATLDYKERLHPETIARIKLGYLCIRCKEPHEAPYPERCALCGYEMRKYQAEDFDRQFKGTERNPRSVLIENELEKLDDKHERNFYVVKNGIVIPKGVTDV